MTPAFTCPICLAEKQIVDAPTDEGKIDQSGNPVFQLSTCDHQFCAPCLRAYVTSKLMDGIYKIPCCCFHVNDEENLHTCKVTIEESDIYRLVHMDMDDSDYRCSSWCHKSSESNLFLASNNDSKSQGLWEKYQKLKFDAHYGKDCVRRCPQCDEAALFDEESMKAYQSRFLTEHAPTPTAGSAGNMPTRNMNRFERAFSVFREWHRDNSAASRLNDNTISTFTESGGMAMQKEQKVMKGDDEHLSKATISAPLTPPPDVDEEAVHGKTMQKEVAKRDNDATICTLLNHAEEACIPDDRKDINESTNEGSKPLETSSAMSTLEVKEEGEPESVVKSTTPVVTCKKCNTEFCYFHSNAHSGKSCIEYHKKHLEEDRSNVECINQILRAKPCPNCGIPVSKEGGCNQMKCGSCGIHFCWICGEIVRKCIC